MHIQWKNQTGTPGKTITSKDSKNHYLHQMTQSGRYLAFIDWKKLSIVKRFIKFLVEKMILHQMDLFSTNLNCVFMDLQVKYWFLGSQKELQMFAIILSIFRNKVIFIISTLSSIELSAHLRKWRQKIFFDPWGVPQAWKNELS